jgi:hypothetical protein
MSVLGNIIKKIKNRGAHSGLNQTSNTGKMAVVIVAPFIIVWILTEVIIPSTYRNVSSLVTFFGWITYLLIYFSLTKAAAAGFLPFPQSHWFTPDGQQVSFDLLIAAAPNGYKDIGPKDGYSDGSHLYKVFLNDMIEIRDRNRPYSDIFNIAIWKTPAEWNIAFERTAHGEFCFRNIFIDHPACENIALSVVYWDERGSTRIPVCVITSCSYLHRKIFDAQGKKIPTPEEIKKETALEAANTELKQKNLEITRHSNYVETELEVYAHKDPADVRKLIESGVNQSREEIIDIMNTKQSWLTRLINGRSIAIALIVLGTLAIIAKALGWI